MPPIVTDRVAWYVGLSPSKSCKATEASEMPFALRKRVGPRNHPLDIAERFEPNTVLWAFYTIQLSSSGFRFSGTVVSTLGIIHILISLFFVFLILVSFTNLFFVKFVQYKEQLRFSANRIVVKVRFILYVCVMLVYMRLNV